VTFLNNNEINKIDNKSNLKKTKDYFKDFKNTFFLSQA
jgi:hypothetical protein